MCGSLCSWSRACPGLVACLPFLPVQPRLRQHPVRDVASYPCLAPPAQIWFAENQQLPWPPAVSLDSGSYSYRS